MHKGTTCRTGTRGTRIGNGLTMPLLSVVIVTVAEVVPGGVTDVGETVQVPSGIVPEHASETAWLKPLICETVSVSVPDFRRGTVIVDGALTPKSQPIPVKLTFCGVPGLGVTTSVAVRVPVTVGLKVTLI